jgi:hypothetical protein
VGEFRVIFTAGQAARDLWAFGEDELAERALLVPRTELPGLWITAATFYDGDYPLPVVGRRITLGHVIAFAAMNHLEGVVRPLSRQRRRSAKTLPGHIKSAAVPFQGSTGDLLEQWRVRR